MKLQWINTFKLHSKKRQLSKAQQIDLFSNLCNLLKYGFTLYQSFQFLNLQMTSKGLSNLRVIDDEANIISFITELNYIKSQAIANQGYINVRFYENSDTIKVIENNKIRFLKLKVGKIINVAKVDIIAFDKKGNINKFGSITIDNNNSIYRIIFHIEKGRIRYEKL